jgi:hypothetical protein
MEITFTNRPQASEDMQITFTNNPLTNMFQITFKNRPAPANILDINFPNTSLSSMLELSDIGEMEMPRTPMSPLDYESENTTKQIVYATPYSSQRTFVDAPDEDMEKLNPTGAEEELPPRDISGWRWGLVVFAILSSTFLFALDNTIVADVQPVIVEHFNEVSKLSWLSVAFLMGSAATNLVWGKVYGQLYASLPKYICSNAKMSSSNGKWTYILCFLLFEVGSAVCGSAPSMNALIIGRAICGVSGSGV